MYPKINRRTSLQNHFLYPSFPLIGYHHYSDTYLQPVAWSFSNLIWGVGVQHFHHQTFTVAFKNTEQQQQQCFCRYSYKLMDLFGCELVMSTYVRPSIKSVLKLEVVAADTTSSVNFQCSTILWLKQIFSYTYKLYFILKTEQPNTEKTSKITITTQYI